MKVVIVGAGISGLFIAYELAKRGVKDIVILEKDYVGAGSTGRCATGIRASFTSREHIVLMKRSIELWSIHSKSELGELGLNFIQSGYLWVARREETLENFKKFIALQNSLGVPTKIVDVDEIKSIVPTINTDVIVGGMYDPTAGKSYVFTTLRALVRACRKYGVDIRCGVEVLRLHAENTKIRYVETSTGIIEGDIFVVAAGANTRDLLRPLGIELPIKNMPRHVLITEAYSRAIDPLVIDWDSHGVPYIVQTTEGNFIIGREIEEIPEISLYSQRIDFIPKALKPISELFPFVENVRVLRSWIGYYITTPDNHPVYGPLKPFENLFIATGFSGHGYMMGPVTGEIIADWILEGRPRIPEAQNLVFERFKTGKLIKELAVVG